MNERRFRLAVKRLTARQPDLTVLLDGVHKGHNLAAIMRSCDAVGVLKAHAVRTAAYKKPSAGTAQGAQKWVYLDKHDSAMEALNALKARGFRVYATALSDTARDFREVDFTQPTAFVLGAEKDGVSQDVLDACEDTLIIPMQGWVESLNVSVACALLLFEAQRQRMKAGMYDESRLSSADFERILFEWLQPTLARYCRDRSIDYPALDVTTGEVLGDIPRGVTRS